jgi:hypothetical protein
VYVVKRSPVSKVSLFSQTVLHLKEEIEKMSCNSDLRNGELKRSNFVFSDYLFWFIAYKNIDDGFQGFTELRLCFSFAAIASYPASGFEGTKWLCICCPTEMGRERGTFIVSDYCQMPGVLQSTHWLLCKRGKYKSNHFQEWCQVSVLRQPNSRRL